MALSATKPTAFALLLLADTSAHAAVPGRYLCADDRSVGLHYEKSGHAWTPHAFVNARYILRKLTLTDQDTKTQRYAPVLGKFPEATWAFFEDRAIDPQPVAVCREDDKQPERLFICQPISVEAQFDVVSRRFQIVRNQGYIGQAMSERFRRAYPKDYADQVAKGLTGDTDHPDDLVLEIGKCALQP